MDTVLESNSESLNLEEEIMKTTQLILELTEAMEALAQRLCIVQAEIKLVYDEIDESRPRKLTDLITHLMSEIRHLEAFPIIPYSPPILRTLSFPTAKGPAEPVQRGKIQFQHYDKNMAMETEMARELREHEREREEQLGIKADFGVVQRTKIQFQHNNKNMATERKMARQLREPEKERQEQLRIKDDFALREANLREKACKIKPTLCYPCPKPLPKKPLKSSIVMWAEKIEYASSLILRDSKNLAPTRKSYEYLRDLRGTSRQFYLQSKIDKKQFAKHWNSMRETRNSFAKIGFDLMKESRRHAESYAEIQRLREREFELNKLLSEMYLEKSKLWLQKSTGSEYLVKLQKKTK